MAVHGHTATQLLDEFGLKVAFSRGGDMRIARDELETEARRDRDLKQLLPTSIAAALQLAAESIICFSFFSRSDHTEGDPLPDEAVASSGRSCAMRSTWAVAGAPSAVVAKLVPRGPRGGSRSVD